MVAITSHWDRNPTRRPAKPPWGSDVPLVYQTTKESSPGGAGNLITMLDACIQLSTSHECGTWLMLGKDANFWVLPHPSMWRARGRPRGTEPQGRGEGKK